MNIENDHSEEPEFETVLRQTRADFVGGFRAAYAGMARLIDALRDDTSGDMRLALR